MKRFCLLLLCGLLLLSATACKNKNPQKDPVLMEDSSTVLLVPNAAISQFITDYNAITKMELHDYIRLETITEYMGVSYECDVYMTDNTGNEENPQFRVTIMGGTTEEKREQMFAVFADVAAALDHYASKEQINNAITYLTEQSAPVSAYRFTGYLEVETYMPIVDTGTGVVGCRIDLVMNQYVVTE